MSSKPRLPASPRSKRYAAPAVMVCSLLAVIGVGLFADPGSPDGTERATAAQSEVDRSVDRTASRGADRTPDATAVPDTTTPPSTVTTVAPTTTAAPSTSTTRPPASSGAHSQSGRASYYAQPWASKGCAHKTLPKGTVVTVTNVVNGKTATCVVNDRGPFVAGRIVDLDVTIFRQLASTSQGVFTARISW